MFNPFWTASFFFSIEHLLYCTWIRRDVPEQARLLTAVARHQRLLRRRASVHRHQEDLLNGVRRLLLITATKSLKSSAVEIHIHVYFMQDFWHYDVTFISVPIITDLTSYIKYSKLTQVTSLTDDCRYNEARKCGYNIRRRTRRQDCSINQFKHVTRISIANLLI